MSTVIDKEMNDAWLAGGRKAHKLELIKLYRNHMLRKTDWWVASGQITDAQKTWRQSLRDIPSNFATEEKLNELMAKNSDKKLTHSIWTIPS